MARVDDNSPTNPGGGLTGNPDPGAGAPGHGNPGPGNPAPWSPSIGQGGGAPNPTGPGTAPTGPTQFNGYDPNSITVAMGPDGKEHVYGTRRIISGDPKVPGQQTFTDQTDDLGTSDDLATVSTNSQIPVGVLQNQVAQVKVQQGQTQAQTVRLGQFTIIGSHKDTSGNTVYRVQQGNGQQFDETEANLPNLPGVQQSDIDQMKSQLAQNQRTLGQSQNWSVAGTDGSGNVVVQDFYGHQETVQAGKSYPGVTTSDIQQAQQKGNELGFMGSQVPGSLSDLASYGQGGFYQGPGTAPPATAPPSPYPGTDPHGYPYPPSNGATPPGAAPPVRGNPWAGGIPAYSQQAPGGPGTMAGDSGGQSDAGAAKPLGGTMGGATAGSGPQRSIPGFGAARPTYTGMQGASGGQQAAGRGVPSTSMAGDTSMGTGYPTRGTTFSGVNFKGTQQDLSLGNQGLQNVYQRNDYLYRLANQGRTQALQSNQDAVQYGQAIREGQGRSFEGMGPLKGSTIVGQ